MKDERWNHLQGLLDRALGMDKEERETFLMEACDEDSEMMTEVVELLDVDELMGDFLEETIADAAQLAGSSLDPLQNQRFFGKYEIIAKVGEGGFGSVHKGRDPILKRLVAIKTCNSSDERLRQRFIREAEISAGLQHPNITIVHDLGFEKGIPFLVQEFLSGEDLSRKISRRDELSPETRLDYLLQIARGLDHAHRKGVLHRDVKPNNVRVLENGRVKILDFGIARLMEEQNPITTEGVAMGTLGYLAPEQLDGRHVDQRSDIFSFGVLAYELLTYERPFQGKTISQTTYRLLHEQPKPITETWPECPEPLDRMISRCLEKDPQQRYPDFLPLIEHLEAIAQVLSEPSSQASVPVPLDDAPQAIPVWRKALIPAGVLLVCTLLAFFFWPQEPSSQHVGAVADLEAPRLEPDRLETSEPELAELQPPTTPQTSARSQTTGPESAQSRTTPSQATQSLTTQSLTTQPQTTQPQTRGPDEPSRSGSRNSDPTQLAQAQVEPSASGAGQNMLGSKPDRQGSSSHREQLPQPAPSEHPETTLKVQTPDISAGASEVAQDATPSGSGSTSTSETEETSPEDLGSDGELISQPQSESTRPVSGAPTDEVGGTAPPDESESEGATTPSEEAETPPATSAPSDSATETQRFHEARAAETAEHINTPPEPLGQLEPIYPPRARNRNLEAKIDVRVLVDEEGRPVDVRASPSSNRKHRNMGFEEAAEEAVLRSRFRPGLDRGVPAKKWVKIVVEFRLQPQ